MVVLATQPSHVHIHTYGSFILPEREREREILIWLHSTHSFSKKFPNVFSVIYFPTVTIDLNSVSLFKPQSYNDT